MQKNIIGKTLLIGAFLLSGISFVSANNGAVFLNRTLERASEKIETIVIQRSQNILDSSTKALIVETKWILMTLLHAIDDDIRVRNRTQFNEHLSKFREHYKLLKYYLSKNVQVVTTETSVPASILYYADFFEGWNAASGDSFSQAFFSSAQCITPFNTLVQVINGNKSVIVKNNDRPNCSLHPDIIDLSKNAFSAIGNLSSGKLAGSVISLQWVNKSYVKKYLSTDLFSPLGIELEQQIPNTYLQNETFHIAGTETLGKADTLLYLQSPSWKDIPLSRKKNAGGWFEYAYPLEEIGTYRMVVTSGLSLETSTYTDIFVLDPAVFLGKKLFPLDYKAAELDLLDIERIEFGDLKAAYLIRFPTKDHYTISLEQWDKKATYSGIGDIAIRSKALEGFTASNPVKVLVTMSKTSTSFSHDTYTVPAIVYSKSMMLVPGYKTEKKENITIALEGANLTVHGMLPEGVKVHPEVILTLPNGNVKKYAFDAASVDSDGFLKRSTVFEQNIVLESIGQYLVEMNYDSGFAAYNGPIIYGNLLPLSASDYDTTDKTIAGSSETISLRSLQFINGIRQKTGRSSLMLDTTLTALATAKANDMATNTYIGHTDSKWEKILGTAKRNGIRILSSIGENVAGGNVGAEILLIGLVNSGGHRENMLGKWEKVGIGYVVKDGQVYYAQEFGE